MPDITDRVRWRRFFHLLAALGCVAVTAASARAVENAIFNAAAESITAEKARDFISVLADDTFEGREAGSRGGRAAGLYVVGQLKAIGAAPAGPGGSFYQSFDGNYSNILTKLEGSDPRLKQEWIVLSAHYDHVGYGARTNSYGPLGLIHNGADDNASGVAEVLQIAAALRQLPTPPKRSILLAFWDGEEKGLLGSKHWTRQPTVPLARVKAMINADMIGRLRANRVEVIGSRSGRGWRRLVSQLNDDPALTLDFSWELKENSDHHSFFARNVPVLMFFTGLHGDYHRPSDDVERLNADGMQRITRLTFKTLLELADGPSAPLFRPLARVESPQSQRIADQPLAPLPGRLGVRWHEKQAASDGVVISHVAADSPAAKAGLRVGDRIVEIAGREVNDAAAFASLVLAAESPAEAVVERVGADEPLRLSIELIGQPVRIGFSWRDDDAEPGTVILNRVTAGSPADRAGLRVGDRIYQIDAQDFKSAIEFRERITAARGQVILTVERLGRLRSVTLELVEEDAAY